MTFNPNIPSRGNRINQQFTLIQNNFSQSNTLFGLDHYAWDFATVPLRGFHKKVTLNQLAATDIPPAAATKGIIYAQNNVAVAPVVTRTDAYYKFDTGTLGNGLVAPVIPFKVFAVFNGNQAMSPIPVANIFQSFNVSSITQVIAAGSRTYTINFANPLDNNPAGTAANYIVLISATLSSTIGWNYQATLNNSFQIVMSNNAGSALVSFGVITL